MKKALICSLKAWWPVLFLLLAISITPFLAGCGHNIGTAFKGKAANLGYDPEFNKFGIQYYDGIIVTGLNKEKTETHLEFFDSAETQGGKTSANMTYTHKTGNQVTGYVVDLAEVEAGREGAK